MKIIESIRPHTKRYHTQFFFLFATLISYLLFRTIQPYISLIFFTTIYALIIWPLHKRIGGWLKLPTWLHSTTTIVVSFLIIVIPLVWLIREVTLQSLSLIETSQVAIESSSIEQGIERINESLGMIPGLAFRVSLEWIFATIQSVVQPILSASVNIFVSISSLSFSFISRFIIFVVLLFFMLPSLPTIVQTIRELSPFSRKATNSYLSRSRAMMHDTVKGMFIIALVQGILAGTFLALLDVPIAAILTIVIMVLSILPVVGSGFVMIPLAIIYFLSGDIAVGLAIFIWQVLVVGSVDNILRPLLVSKEADLHPALMMLAVFGGITAFGVMGILYGPLIMVLGMATLQIYKEEYQ